MRRLAFAALTLLASTATAETPKPATIETVVKANLAAIAEDDPKIDKLQLAKVHAIATYFSEIDEKHLGDSSYNLSMLYRGPYGNTKHKLGTGSYGTADGVAWFSLPYHLSVYVGNPSGGGYGEDNDQRVAGVAVPSADGKSWEIFGVHYARIVSDKELMKADSSRNMGSDKPGAATITGDKELAGVVQGWLAKGFTGHATTLGTPLVSGTAPTESATGKDTAKLTGAWDGLHLIATDMQAHVHSSGTIGFVTVTVQFDRPKGQKGQPVRMGLSVVLVKEGKEWTWAALTFSA